MLGFCSSGLPWFIMNRQFVLTVLSNVISSKPRS